MRIQRSEILKLLFICVCLPNAVCPAPIHTGCFLRLLVGALSPQIASNPVPPPFSCAQLHRCDDALPMPYGQNIGVFLFCFFFFSFVLGQCFGIKAQAHFKFVILLLQPFKCWENSCALSSQMLRS